MNNDYCEDLVTYKFLFDAGFANTVFEYFNESCCHKDYNRHVVGLVRSFLSKNGYHPKRDDLNFMLEGESSRTLFKRALGVYRDLDKDVSDEILYRKAEEFIKIRKLYNALSETTDEFKNGRGIAESIDVLKRFESV